MIDTQIPTTTKYSTNAIKNQTQLSMRLYYVHACYAHYRSQGRNISAHHAIPRTDFQKRQWSRFSVRKADMIDCFTGKRKEKKLTCMSDVRFGGYRNAAPRKERKGVYVSKVCKKKDDEGNLAHTNTLSQTACRGGGGGKIGTPRFLSLFSSALVSLKKMDGVTL